MRTDDDAVAREHTRLILDRYADRENIGILHTPPEVVLERYLSRVLSAAELKDKVILEIGAGGSQTAPVFLESGCARYYANDIIPERLAATRKADPRYVELPGDFRMIEVPEPADIVFASLTMMLVMPMLDEFVAKIHSVLKPGGVFMSMDANYLCPLSIYRRFADKRANPVRLFSPFAYAGRFRSAGFEVEKLVPFTAPAPRIGSNWLLGTTFWLRARKL